MWSCGLIPLPGTIEPSNYLHEIFISQVNKQNVPVLAKWFQNMNQLRSYHTCLWRLIVTYCSKTSLLQISQYKMATYWKEKICNCEITFENRKEGTHNWNIIIWLLRNVYRSVVHRMWILSTQTYLWLPMISKMLPTLITGLYCLWRFIINYIWRNAQGFCLA